MGVITLKIDDELEDKLRKRVGRVRGAARGAISESVEDAIRIWLKTGSAEELKDQRGFFVAKKNEKTIAEASSLFELSGKLKELGEDPREVIIESQIPRGNKRKMGLRITSRSP